MSNHALLVHLEAQHGKGPALEQFLQNSLALVNREPGTSTWFALKFGRSDYGIFDTFPGEDERTRHLSGAVPTALQHVADDLLAEPPRIQPLSVLASVLHTDKASLADTKAVLLKFKAKPGHEDEVASFLRSAEALVQTEPRTTAWFALDFEDGEFGIFDTFPDNGARFAHITGHVPRELAKHALSLIGSLPDMDMVDVLAEKIGNLSSSAQAQVMGKA
jgi:hypothetical protein